MGSATAHRSFFNSERETESAWVPRETVNKPGSPLRTLLALEPERIVIESTGGYERRLVAKLAEADLPVVVVNPRRVRSFGQGMGILAKTDAIDARLLPSSATMSSRRSAGRSRRRRRQLVAMVVAEKNRRETACQAVHRSITAVLRLLEKQLDQLEERIEKLLLEDPERGRAAADNPRRRPGRHSYAPGRSPRARTPRPARGRLAHRRRRHTRAELAA